MLYFLGLETRSKKCALQDLDPQPSIFRLLSNSATKISSFEQQLLT
jgi:hypothetical protein